MRLPQDRILHIDTECKDGKVNIVAEWQGELVRCKDCKFSELFQNDSSGVMARYCKAFTFEQMVADNDYCSYGERKGGDTE